MRIGHLGAYSIDNAGDVLVGYATRQALRALHPTLDIQTFSPNAPHRFWGHVYSTVRGIDTEVVPIEPDSGLRWTAGLDALVIGGGGLISSEPSFSSFLLEGGDDPCPPAAWNSVGSLNEAWYLDEFAPIYDAVRTCARRLAYLSVRDRLTLAYLRRLGVTRDIAVVPDPAFLLQAPPDRDRELLRRHGVDPEAFVIGLSVGYSVLDIRTRSFFKKLYACLEHLARASGARVQIVVFPFGTVYGDPSHQAHARDGIPSCRHLDASLTPLELWRLIGSLDLYVATRFHAVIAAFAQDVPFVILDEYLDDAVASSKLRELAVDHGLEPYYLSPWISTKPEQKLRHAFEAARSGKLSFATEVAGLRARLVEHYHRLLGALAIPVTGKLTVGEPDDP